MAFKTLLCASLALLFSVTTEATTITTPGGVVSPPASTSAVISPTYGNITLLNGGSTGDASTFTATGTGGIKVKLGDLVTNLSALQLRVAGITVNPAATSTVYSFMNNVSGSLTLQFSPSAKAVYHIIPSGPINLTFSGVLPASFQEMEVIIQQGLTAYPVTLPSSTATFLWQGGVPPVISTVSKQITAFGAMTSNGIFIGGL